MGCFIRPFFWTASCSMRAIWSEAPPAPAATTISTGLVGSHASAALPKAGAASATAPNTRKRLQMFAIFISLGKLTRPALAAVFDIQAAFCAFATSVQGKTRPAAGHFDAY